MLSIIYALYFLGIGFFLGWLFAIYIKYWQTKLWGSKEHMKEVGISITVFFCFLFFKEIILTTPKDDDFNVSLFLFTILGFPIGLIIKKKINKT